MDRAQIIEQARNKQVQILPPGRKNSNIDMEKEGWGEAGKMYMLRQQRFCYEEYMKNLQDKIQGGAPNTNAYVGSDF